MLGLPFSEHCGPFLHPTLGLQAAAIAPTVSETGAVCTLGAPMRRRHTSPLPPWLAKPRGGQADAAPCSLGLGLAVLSLWPTVPAGPWDREGRRFARRGCFECTPHPAAGPSRTGMRFVPCDSPTGDSTLLGGGAPSPQGVGPISCFCAGFFWGRGIVGCHNKAAASIGGNASGGPASAGDARLRAPSRSERCPPTSQQ